MNAQEIKDREPALRDGFRRDVRAKLQAGANTLDAVADVAMKWTANAESMGWDLDTRAVLVTWLMDESVALLTAAAERFLADA